MEFEIKRDNKDKQGWVTVSRPEEKPADYTIKKG